MSSASFKNIFVPTLISSSVFFYMLITASSLVKLQSLAESPPLPTNRLQFVSSKENKDLTIRNVGFCILGSVGAGLVVAEISRKVQDRRKGAQLHKQQFAKQSVAHNPLDQPVAAKALASEPELNQVSFDPNESNRSLQQRVQEDTSSGRLISSSLDRSHWNSGKDVPMEQAAQESNSVASFVLQPHSQRQTCRVKVPHLKQSLFAVQFNGEYYSFARTEKDKEKALHTLARLFDRGDQAIITHTPNKYIIWLWQPYAELEVS